MRRSDAAIDADDIGAPSLHVGGKLLGRRPIESVAVIFDRHLRNDRQRRHAPDRADRRAHLVQVSEGFEDEQIDLAVEQCLRLFAKHRLGFVEAGLAPGLDAYAERTDRARDVGLPARRSTCEAGTFGVDFVYLVGQSERLPMTIATGGVAVGIGDDFPRRRWSAAGGAQ